MITHMSKRKTQKKKVHIAPRNTKVRHILSK